MYGGLFGDLPKTKKAKEQEDAEGYKNGDNKEKADDTSAEQHESKKRPKVVEPKNSSTTTTYSSYMVKNLGVAETTMAFVPTVALKRKGGPNNKKQKQVTARKMGTVSGLKTPTGNSTAAGGADYGERVVAKNLDLATWKDVSSSEQDYNDKNYLNRTGISDSPSSPSHQTAGGEPEELRRLHENVKDPYDPLVPNDLLQYWEQKAAMLERVELEREAKETMETQMRIQQTLERERQELEKKGDIDKLVEHRQKHALPVGRGRGRGVSNLPAWYVEKQKKIAEARPQPPR